MPLPVPSVTASLFFAALLGWCAIDFPLWVCLVCAFVVPSETIFKPLPQRDRFFILCRFACLVCNKFPFVLLSVWSFNLHLKQNSVTASLFFEALPYLVCNIFPLCLCQFQAKQLLNLCRFVGLLVWSFNLHQKRNSVTASLSFTALLGALQVQ